MVFFFGRFVTILVGFFCYFCVLLFVGAILRVLCFCVLSCVVSVPPSKSKANSLLRKLKRLQCGSLVQTFMSAKTAVAFWNTLNMRLHFMWCYHQFFQISVLVVVCCNELFVLIFAHLYYYILVSILSK